MCVLASNHPPPPPPPLPPLPPSLPPPLPYALPLSSPFVICFSPSADELGGPTLLDAVVRGAGWFLATLGALRQRVRKR